MNVTTIHHQPQNHNNKIGFKALQGVRYSGTFCPSESLNHAKIVKAFQEQNDFKKFTEMFDVVADFYNEYIVHFYGEDYYCLTLKYKEIKPREKNIFKRLASFFVEKETNDMHKIKLITTGDGADKKLQKKINKISFENLMVEHQRNLKKLAQKHQQTQELKAINNEINDTFRVDIYQNKN